MTPNTSTYPGDVADHVGLIHTALREGRQVTLQQFRDNRITISVTAPSKFWPRPKEKETQCPS